jgi:predicted amidohydrolase
MKVALAVPNITNIISDNYQLVLHMIISASHNAAKLIIFPEAVFSGLNNNDIYEHDIELTMSTEDDRITRLCELACNKKVWICFGFLENDHGCIYDSALLVNPLGERVIHYRRINPQWRARNLPTDKYAEGREIPTALTPFGNTAILICGDLFDADVVDELKKQKPQLLLLPFARCFPNRVIDEQNEWDTVEINAYATQVKLVAANLTMMTNYFAERSMNGGGFGGAFVMDINGNTIASLPLMQEGILYFDLID